MDFYGRNQIRQKFKEPTENGKLILNKIKISFIFISLRLLDIQLFAKLDNFPNVLEALLAGPNMKAFETMSDSQLIEDCMWLLQKFLAIPLPKPITMKRTKWLTNPNFLGSYSYHSMDATKFNVTSKDLGQTLYNLKQKPEILFAGEHTDELYSSNAHGAVNSGFKAANELIKYYSKL